MKPPSRKTRSVKVTWCTDCERWVGVQRGAEPGRLSYYRESRIVRHKYKDTGRVCWRSGLTLPDNLIFDREVS